MKFDHLNSFFSATKILNGAMKLLFLTILIGQWIFVYYLLVAYGGLAIGGDMSDWNQLMPHGYVAGDTIGNTAVLIHIVIAFIIMGIGPIQFIPFVRNKLPKFHRYNGRVYLFTAVLTSLVGLYMVNTRGTVGGLAQYLGISIDALLIIICAYLTYHYAVRRQLKVHRQWALRLFMVASAVWFYRVGLMFWLAINGGPVGIDFKTFTGPFLSFLAFAQYLIPLAILEIYIRVKQSGSPTSKIMTALLLVVSTFVIAFGIFAAYKGLWLPKIEKII
jgi:hypothetical protein